MTLEQLQQQRDALRNARYQGVLTVRAGDKWVTYKSDADMRAALAAIDREIAALQGRPRRRRLLMCIHSFLYCGRLATPSWRLHGAPNHQSPTPRSAIPSPPSGILTLFRKLGVNPDWLETGTGPMYLRTDKGYGVFEDVATVVPEHMAAPPPQASPIVVPVYSTQCRWERDCNIRESEIIGRIALPRSHAGDHIRVYRNESDALAPLIRKGAHVGIDTALRHPTSGDTFAVAIPPEGIVFRKLWLQPGSTPDVPGLAILRAESPDYPESAMRIDDFSKIVIGRLVWALQAY